MIAHSPLDSINKLRPPLHTPSLGFFVPEDAAYTEKEKALIYSRVFSKSALKWCLT